MKDKNLVIAILVGSMLALAACGSISQADQNESAAEAGTEATVEIPNPWHETADLEEAEKAAGVDFEPPVENSLPEGFEFVSYRYTDKILEATYSKGDEELVIRVSTTQSGLELSGDYNAYMKRWEVNFKGLVVECNGDGTLSNCSYADLENIHFSVLINPGDEGKGLSEEQLKSLFMGMQAKPLES